MACCAAGTELTIVAYFARSRDRAMCADVHATARQARIAITAMMPRPMPVETRNSSGVLVCSKAVTKSKRALLLEGHAFVETNMWKGYREVPPLVFPWPPCVAAAAMITAPPAPAIIDTTAAVPMPHNPPPPAAAPAAAPELVAAAAAPWLTIGLPPPGGMQTSRMPLFLF